MTSDQFLQALLAAQDLSPEQERALQAHKTEITDFLRAEFGSAPEIKYAGSRQKGTMIRERYDLDVVSYFPSSDPRSLREIREAVADRLGKRYLLRHKPSAERILDLQGAGTPSDYHVDVVPGRFIGGSSDVFLHVKDGERDRLQTNLKTHIDHIVGSGCVPVIRLAKLWAHRNSVDVKTFVLELFVVRALSGSHEKSSLAKSLRRVLEALRDEFDTLQLVDPANSNNVVSRLVSSSDQELVADAADEALATLGEFDDAAGWGRVFNERGGVSRALPGTPGILPAPSRPSLGFTPHSPHSTHADGSR